MASALTRLILCTIFSAMVFSCSEPAKYAADTSNFYSIAEQAKTIYVAAVAPPPAKDDTESPLYPGVKPAETTAAQLSTLLSLKDPSQHLRAMLVSAIKDELPEKAIVPFDSTLSEPRLRTSLPAEENSIVILLHTLSWGMRRSSVDPDRPFVEYTVQARLLDKHKWEIYWEKSCAASTEGESARKTKAELLQDGGVQMKAKLRDLANICADELKTDLLNLLAP